MVFKTADHKILIPASILLGSSTLLFSDIISQLPGSRGVLPINAITSLLGIPVVIWIIVRNHKLSKVI
jgi:iron complex transport system permease protein